MFYDLKNRSTFLELGVCGMHKICTCVINCVCLLSLGGNV